MEDRPLIKSEFDIKSTFAKLQQLRFSDWGEIFIRGTRLVFSETEALKAERDEGFVYAFVEISAETNRFVETNRFYVKYVGMARTNWTDRWKNGHKRGFHSLTPNAGWYIAECIGRSIQRGCTIKVLGRQSCKEILFGQEISRCSVEEVALIELLKPTWNNGGAKAEIGYGSIAWKAKSFASAS